MGHRNVAGAGAFGEARGLKLSIIGADTGFIQEAPMNQNSNHHSVRRIVLPSGRTIEVVRFHEDPKPPAPGLHICPECESDLVQPVAWSDAGSERWELSLRCPNCFWETEGSYSQNQIEQLEEQLDDGIEAILTDLQRLTHANMEDQLARFVAALQADLILPEDF
jgi:hypothetical protein